MRKFLTTLFYFLSVILGLGAFFVLLLGYFYFVANIGGTMWPSIMIAGLLLVLAVVLNLTTKKQNNNQG